MANGHFETAEKAIAWIHGARYKGQKNGLENTRALLAMLGDPQNGYKMIHVAGTNGKGSTCAYCSSALIEAGYNVGLYTSPYLIKYNERIQVNGKPISDEELIDIADLLVDLTDELTAKGIYPTTFELGTAMAFEYFRRRNVDYAVIEVGLGGRFDSTNVITPVVSAIASIALDHTKTLGDTIEQIAFEKAGIIKECVPAVVMDQQESVISVFKEAAAQRRSPLTITGRAEVLSSDAYGSAFLYRGEKYTTHLCGAYQIKNAALAIEALLSAGIDHNAIACGIEKAKWPCRLEWVDGILIDGAHNPDGAASLAGYIKEFFSDRNITLITGMMKDKDITECAEIMSGFADEVITVAADDPRAEEPEALANVYSDLSRPSFAAGDVGTAIEMARGKKNMIVIAGSLYIAGEARKILRGDDCF